MRVSIISTNEKSGGAARAANRLHRALLNSGVESKMHVGIKESQDSSIEGLNGYFRKKLLRVYPYAEAIINKFQRTSNEFQHSSGLFGVVTPDQINRSQSDIINLHWINSGFLSIKCISKINKPIVWTLHDSWPFCATEHYPDGLSDFRYKTGYKASNRPESHWGFDLDAFIWRRKKKYWTKQMHIVTPSRWLAGCAKESELMNSWPVSVIPNPIDTTLFRPVEKIRARDVLGIEHNRKIILFGALGNTNDPRKGFDLLKGALNKLAKQESSEYLGLIFGYEGSHKSDHVGVELKYTGHINDDNDLAVLYSAADVMVVPSRIENLPQTATEALACGTPVVAFNCGGLIDIIEHKKTGYLATPYDVDDLAKGVKWVLHHSEYEILAKNSRTKAILEYDKKVVAMQYLDLFAEIYQRSNKNQ